MADKEIRLTVNDMQRTVSVPERITLADMLRDYLDLTGTHLGCEQGACGACTVMVDGLPVRACLVLAMSCAGSEVVTVEGLRGEDIDRLRESFSQHGALQCGFCTPGMLIAAHELVRRRQDMSRDDVAVEMSGNICRCTGYKGIVTAVKSTIDEGIEAEKSTEMTRA